ncbi:hypothetical protein Nepgr_033376 [Nepenthes gracilis]|uniref:Uncharacterized protein n=1 Tax=Nepenthes gracilis TaxID=150966 RepID=A0AAD3TKI4_NEPGR|nr:hypothetical protein Nepgr_033376 [Nepenthes gracilis]
MHVDSDPRGNKISISPTRKYSKGNPKGELEGSEANLHSDPFFLNKTPTRASSHNGAPSIGQQDGDRMSPGIDPTSSSTRSVIVVLVETKISGVRADIASSRIGFGASTRVEAQGFSGGIWVFWRDDRVKVNILSRNHQ